MAELSNHHKSFSCPICLELLIDPATTNCGHSFCMRCINACWNQDDQKGVYSCPQCKKNFSSRPALCKNIVLAEVVELMRREQLKGGAVSSAPISSLSGDVKSVYTETKQAIQTHVSYYAPYNGAPNQSHHTAPALNSYNKAVFPSPRLQNQICSLHDKALELYCCQDQKLICMQCSLLYHQDHQVTSIAEERHRIQREFLTNCSTLQQEVLQRESKLQELRDALESYKGSAQTAIKHNESAFSLMSSSMVKRRADITKSIRAQVKGQANKVDELVTKLEQEINDLKKRHELLGQLQMEDDNIYVVQKFIDLFHYKCSNITNISPRPCLFENIKTILSELKDQVINFCENEFVRISEKVSGLHIKLNDEKIPMYLPSRPKTREEFLAYAIRLDLRSSTVGKNLRLSQNSVSVCDSHDSNVSTDTDYQLLFYKRLSDLSYFEVEFESRACEFGFSYNLSSDIFGSDERSWKIAIDLPNLTVVHNKKYTRSSVSKIGVFFNQKEGNVSFYSVSEKMILLHTVQTNFTQPVYPGFLLCKYALTSRVTICDLPYLESSS